MDTKELIYLVATLAIFISYHMWFTYNMVYHPHNTMAGWTSCVRRSWVAQILHKKSGDILAVQTLRNWILAATMLATACVAFSFGLMSFIAQSFRVADPGNNTFLRTILEDQLIGFKTVAIIGLNFTAFFSFTQSIRYFNHCGFAINIPTVGQKN
ncbi:hypothetical protein BC833DRAFT_613162, partial [Globomyces pollinis-pini]